MYLNNVTLVGDLITEPSTRNAKRAKGDKPMLVLEFKLRVLRQSFSRERLTIRVVLFGGAAETFIRYGKKKGDYVLISGRLCVRVFDGKEGGKVEHHYVVAEQFRFLYGPPGKFVKGYVMVSKDEYERFKRLEAEAGGRFHVPADAEALLRNEDLADEQPEPSEAVPARRFGYDGREEAGHAPGWDPS